MNMFQSVPTERVTLVKKDGQRFEDLRAVVQPNLIMTDNPKIPIEDGDQFQRQLPSGIVGVFTVVDSGFHQRFHSIPAHYQSKVRKNTATVPPGPRPEAGPQVVYNLIGSNARVNIQSSDSSTNVVSVESAVLFDDLREAIRKSSLDSNVVQQLIQNVDAMQSATGTKTFGERYKEFVVAAADHMTLIAPFLPALTQLLLQGSRVRRGRGVPRSRKNLRSEPVFGVPRRGLLDHFRCRRHPSVVYGLTSSKPKIRILSLTRRFCRPAAGAQNGPD